jgi:hypothetical protein
MYFIMLFFYNSFYPNIYIKRWLNKRYLNVFNNAVSSSDCIALNGGILTLNEEGRSPGTNLKPVRTEYEEGMLTTGPRHSVLCHI